MKKVSDKDVMEGVGTRAREMRKWLRLSQGAVAEFLKVPRSAVSAIEAGTRSVSIQELIAFCRLFRCNPNLLLGLERAPIGSIAPEATPLYFNARTTSKSQDVDEQDTKEIENFVANLRERKGKSLCTHQLLKASNPKEPKAAAELLRLELKLEDVPVDIYEVIKRLGIALRFSTLGELSGALIREKNEDETIFGIVVNSDQPDDRVRFSAAHEVAHAFMAHEPDDSRMYSPKGRRFDGIEKDADAFAAEVLMPPSVVLSRVDALKKKNATIRAEDVYQLSDDFLVSYQAMLIRLSNLGAISSVDYKEFSEQKPSELASRIRERSSQTKTKEFNPKELKKIVEKEGLPEGGAGAQDSDWVRNLQECAVEQYLASTSIGNRSNDVKRVHEAVVLWVADTYPLEFEASFKVPSQKG